jgi:hypothetical protein
LATAAVATAKLRELSLRVPTTPLSPAMPLISGVFKMDKNANAVQIDVSNPAKTIQIEASLDPK